MDIQKKQATWNQERPLFEENFIHSHLLEYFSFNESTGDYELVEVTPNFVARDVVYEVLNTGWAMWLRAKCNAKSQAVPEKTCSIQGHEIIVNETKNELINDYDIAKEDEYLLEALVYRGVCIGKSQAVPEGFVLVPKEPSADLVNHGHQVFLGHFNEGGQTGGRSLYFAYKAMIEAQEQSHDE